MVSSPQLCCVRNSFQGIPRMSWNWSLMVGDKASGGLRATSLFTVTNLYAGLNASNYHFPCHWLWCVLGAGYCSILDFPFGSRVILLILKKGLFIKYRNDCWFSESNSIKPYFIFSGGIILNVPNNRSQSIRISA